MVNTEIRLIIFFASKWRGSDRFTKLHLIDRVPNELWTEVHCTKCNDQDHTQEKEMKNRFNGLDLIDE